MKTKNYKDSLIITFEKIDEPISYEYFMKKYFDELITQSEKENIILNFNNMLVEFNVSAVLVLLHKNAKISKRKITFKGIKNNSPLGFAIKSMHLDKILNIEE